MIAPLKSWVFHAVCDPNCYWILMLFLEMNAGYWVVIFALMAWIFRSWNLIAPCLIQRCSSNSSSADSMVDRHILPKFVYFWTKGYKQSRDRPSTFDLASLTNFSLRKKDLLWIVAEVHCVDVYICLMHTLRLRGSICLMWSGLEVWIYASNEAPSDRSDIRLVKP